MEVHLHAQAVGVLFQGGLGDAVDPGKGQRIQRRKLAARNDNPGALAQQGEKRPVHPINAEQIDLKQPGEGLLVHLHQGIQVIHPGQMDDGVEALRLLPHLCKGFLHGGSVGQVGGNKTQVFRRPRCLTVQAEHRPSLFQQSPARSLSHTAAGTGDQCSLAHSAAFP